MSGALKEGRIEAGGDYGVPRSARKNLDPGTFTFIAEPGVQWFLIYTITICVAGLAVMVNGFFVLAFVESSESSDFLLVGPGLIVGALTALYFTIRDFWKTRHPRAKIVFYQPRKSLPGQNYGVSPIESSARFEVYFRGELRESGEVTNKNLMHFGFSYLSVQKYNRTRRATSACIFLKSELVPPDADDPFSSILCKSGGYTVFEKSDGVDFSKTRNLAAELREFLGLTRHEDSAFVDDGARDCSGTRRGPV